MQTSRKNTVEGVKITWKTLSQQIGGCPFARFVPPQVFTCVHRVSSRRARGTQHGVCL